MSAMVAMPLPHNAEVTGRLKGGPPAKKMSQKAREDSASFHNAAHPPLLPTPSAARSTPSNLVICLDDLAVRFIVNCPAETPRDEMMLLMFEVEKAFWFYLDFWREHDTSLPSLNMKDFSRLLFNHCAMLQPYAGRLDAILAEWQMHKKQVPTYGACILNETLSKVLLVRGWKSSSWGWPKGKVNKNEDELVCAAREVAEEIGFDISSYISASNVLSCKVGDVLMKLYVVAGVPEDTHFETQTRKEISEIKWHTLRNLGEETGPKMYSVSPVLGRLRGWVSDHMRSLSRSKTPDRECSDSAPMSSSSSPRTRKGRRAAKEGIVKEEVDAAGVARDNEQTFGSGSSKNFSVEDMFRVNKEKFGIESTYNFEQYTTKLHKQSERKVDAHKCMYAERYRPCQIRDVASSTDGGSVCTSSRSSVVGDEVESSIEEKTCLVGFMFDRDAILGCMTFV